MRLRDLDARFLGRYAIENGRTSYYIVDTFDEAQGVMFQCPKCASGATISPSDTGRLFIGVHHVICWFRKPAAVEQVPDDASPGPGRWNASGTGLDDLTFVGPEAFSVKLTSGCGWHGFVTNGDAT